MAGKELAAQVDLALIAREWAIDLGEAREKVFRLIDLIQEKMIPLAREHEKWMKVGGEYGRLQRVRVLDEVDRFLENEIGVVAPPEARLRPGQPCMLVWDTCFSTIGSEYMPVFVEIARMAGEGGNHAGDIVVDAVGVCEIPINKPDPQRVERRDLASIHRRIVGRNSRVVVPLNGQQ